MTQVAVFNVKCATKGTNSLFRSAVADCKTFFLNFIAVLNLDFTKISSAFLLDFPWPVSFVVYKGTDSMG